MLVSGSIDNKVIVWRLPTDNASTAKFVNPSQILEQHTSFVKVWLFYMHTRFSST